MTFLIIDTQGETQQIVGNITSLLPSADEGQIKLICFSPTVEKFYEYNPTTGQWSLVKERKTK